MAYKFQKGTANLSGSIKLDSGYDLLGAGSNDLGTSAAGFAVGYVSVLSASTVVSGAFFEGSGARLTNVAATDITTTGTSTNAEFYPLFVDTSGGESGETIRVHSTIAINPGTGKLSATSLSASTGTGSFGGGISAGNEGFNVGYTGEVTATQYKTNDVTYGDSGITMDTDGGHFTIEQDDADKSVRVVLGATNAGTSGFGIRQANNNQVWGVMDNAAVSGSGALSVGAGATLAGALNIQAGGITNAGSIAGATTLAMGGTLTGATTISGSGALSVGAGATLAGALNMQAAGITNAGAIAGATTVDSTGLASLDGGIDVNGSNFTAGTDGAVTATSLNVQTGAITNASTISGSGALSVGAGATMAGALNMQNGGVTNAGSLAGVTTIVASSTISGSGALSVGAGATLAGALNMQNGGITNAGAIAAATTISGSGLLSPAGGINVAETFTVSAAGAVVADQYKTDGNEFVVSTAGLVTATGIANSNAGITNAGAIAGATTIAMGGTLTGATTISGSGALSVGAGATFAGAVNLQAGGITNAGVIAGTTLLTASTGLSGATVYADKFYGDGANISGLTMDPAGSDTNIQFNQNDSLAADTGFYYNGTGSFVVGEGKAFGSNNTGMLSRFTASADAGSGVFGGLYLGSGTINAGSSYIMRSNFGGGVQSIWKEEAGELLLTGSTGIKLQGDMTQTGKFTSALSSGDNFEISASGGDGTGFGGLDVKSTMNGGASITAVGGILAGHEGSGVAAVKLNTSGEISGSSLLVNGALDAGYGGFQVDADGDTIVKSLDVNSGGITEAGAISGVSTIVASSTISGSGALSIGAGATLAGALNIQNGGITNAGSIAGATTVAMGGTLTGATTISGSGALSIGAGATLAGALNMQAGGITNAGAIAGATTVNASSAVTAGSLVTNTLSRSSGDLTVQLHDASTNNVSFRLAGGSMPLRVLSTGIVQMNGGEVLIGTSTGEVSGSVAKFDSLSASADVVAGYYYGNGSNLTGISSDAVDVTSSTSDRAYGLVFTEAANSVGGLGLALQLTGATFNPATAALSGSGALTFDSITVGQGYSISSAGAATLGATSATTITGSGALSIGAGATLAGALNMQNGGITNAGAIAGATTLGSSGAATLDSGANGSSFGGALTVASLSVGDGNITNVGTISVDKIDTDGASFELDLDSVTTGNGYVSLADNLAEAFFVAQGANTYLTFVTTNNGEQVKSSQDFVVGDNVNSGKFLSLNGGLDFKGQKTLTASVNLDEDGESGVYHYQSHYIVSGSSAVVIDLPSLDNGYSMWFKRHPSMTNNVTVRPSGSTNLIDGINDPVVLETAGASIQLVGSGSLNWYIY